MATVKNKNRKMYDPDAEEDAKAGKKPEFKGEKKNPRKLSNKPFGAGKSDSKTFGKRDEKRSSREGRSSDKRNSRGR